MAGGAGTIGEGVQDLTLDALLDEALTGVRAAPAVVRRVAPTVAATVVRVPPRAISQALRSLVTNAQDASAGAEVAVSAAIAAGAGSAARSPARPRRRHHARRAGPAGRAVLHHQGARAAAWAWACTWRGRSSRGVGGQLIDRLPTPGRGTTVAADRPARRRRAGGARSAQRPPRRVVSKAP
jgi:hypothetical protein